MSRRLTFEEAKILLDREVLGVMKSMVCVDGLSKAPTDSYDVKNIIVGDSDIIIMVSKPCETKTYITSYKFIKSIGDMDIERLLGAYDIDSNKTYEIDDYTDVLTTVIGKEEAMIGDIELDEGMKFILHNDANEKYCNKVLTVKYDENDMIKLVANRGRPKKIR